MINSKFLDYEDCSYSINDLVWFNFVAIPGCQRRWLSCSPHSLAGMLVGRYLVFYNTLLIAFH